MQHKSHSQHPLPKERDTKLPWQSPPKSIELDSRAKENLEAIVNSPTYKKAMDDREFLLEEATLPIRLQLDYLKVEEVLQRFGIEKTVVVYGSTRIVEPRLARSRLEEIEREMANGGSSQELEKKFKRAEKIVQKSKYYDMAREFGSIVGSAGGGAEDNRVTLMTGGGPGIMEAANRGTFDVGANSIGLNITLPHEQFPNPYITPDLCFLFHYFAIRKLHFMKRACALVIFPGGYGTLDELFEALTLIQTRKIAPIPVVFVGEEYWSRVIDFEALEDEGVIDSEDRDIFWYANSAKEAWDGIVQWHEENGTVLFGL